MNITNNEDKAEFLASTYQRQYHHNTYPELSNNSEFVTSKEEIKEACMEMAEWKEKQIIEKACDILENMISEIFLRYMRGEEIKDIISDFRKAMEE